MSQPKWKLAGTVGDVNPVDYGGGFIFVDETGVYPPELELIEVDESAFSDEPDDEPEFDEDGELINDFDELEQANSDKGKWTVYRFSLERCTYQNGILSDNKFHPDHAAWFAKPEAEKANRPQDTTYLSNVAGCNDVKVEQLIEWFCSEDVQERARAYMEIGSYHGYDSLDHDPLEFDSREEMEKRVKNHPYLQ